MNWMVKWAGAFPPFVREAQGAHFFDVDGHRYTDFCLGDTGAMTGHSPFATVKAAEEQMRRGITLMLPGEDAIAVAEELQKRFNLPYWQFALTATDANRFSIRLARQITGRPKILVFNWCYHGTVDETFITLAADGTAGPRPGNIGPPVNPAVTTKVIEFNDVAALEQALADEDVACVLAEPAMTNVGIVHPQPGYHQALRELASSWGFVQIMGFHVIGRNRPVRDLLDPPFHYSLANRLLAEFAASFHLDVSRDAAELFHCWNTGRPDGRTADPAYVENGLRRMEIYREVAGELKRIPNSEFRIRDSRFKK